MSTYTVPLLINGGEVTTDQTFPVVSPSNHNEIWLASSASLSNVSSAIAAAQSAYPAWSKSKPATRRDIFLKAADIFLSRAKEFGEYMKEETGAQDAFAGGFNVPLAAEMMKDVAGRCSGIQGVIPTCADESTAALVVKEPYGVVLGIAPW
jgi:acyl-CoA reductase-like NAD-dependent aldehyde dehydrogenase